MVSRVIHVSLTDLGLKTEHVLANWSKAKDKLYNNLSSIISEVPEQDPIFILGDLNTRVGAIKYPGLPVWDSLASESYKWKRSASSWVLLHNNLCITNTFFNTKPQHKVSWRHPRSKHWHQLDLVLTRCKDLGSVKITRNYQSADCDTDHSLVCSKVMLQPSRVHRSKKAGQPRIDMTRTRLATQRWWKRLSRSKKMSCQEYTISMSAEDGNTSGMLYTMPLVRQEANQVTRLVRRGSCWGDINSHRKWETRSLGIQTLTFCEKLAGTTDHVKPSPADRKAMR